MWSQRRGVMPGLPCRARIEAAPRLRSRLAPWQPADPVPGGSHAARAGGLAFQSSGCSSRSATACGRRIHA